MPTLSPTHLAARIPETLVGCRFNGIDLEHWVGEQLIDLLALGSSKSWK